MTEKVIPVAMLQDELEDAAKIAKKVNTPLYVSLIRDVEEDKILIATGTKFPRGNPCIEVRPDGTAKLQGKMKG
jgi:arginase family enzyme